LGHLNLEISKSLNETSVAGNPAGFLQDNLSVGRIKEVLSIFFVLWWQGAQGEAMSNSSFEILDGQVVEQEMVIMPLGGGQEVGRSCILLKYRGRTILLDCGIHPGREGMDSCPFFDMVEPETVDLILISHFHIDHCASLPYFTEKTNFKVCFLLFLCEFLSSSFSL
jgi:predicted metal-dependent RNase